MENSNSTQIFKLGIKKLFKFTSSYKTNILECLNVGYPDAQPSTEREALNINLQRASSSARRCASFPSQFSQVCKKNLSATTTLINDGVWCSCVVVTFLSVESRYNKESEARQNVSGMSKALKRSMKTACRPSPSVFLPF